MGREIKRVALDFDWPLDVTWYGYLNPYRSSECAYCKGSGYGAVARDIADDWYGSAEAGRRWCDAITDDEVAALVERGRLMDFTHTWTSGEGWQRRADGYVPTAAEVNAAARGRRGFLHDAINRGICIEARCKRLGIELLCGKCSGSGVLWQSPELEQAHEAWRPIQPPAGEGWQVWQTVGEGSPITPVFATPEALARHLADVGDEWTRRRPDQNRPTYTQALAFVTAGWAPSGMVVSGVHLGPYEIASDGK